MKKAHEFYHSDFREFVVKRKSRTYHNCDECGADILPDEEYYSDTSGQEHNFRRAGGHEYYTHKVCEACWKGIELSARPKTREDFILEEAKT